MMMNQHAAAAAAAHHGNPIVTSAESESESSDGGSSQGDDDEKMIPEYVTEANDGTASSSRCRVRDSIPQDQDEASDNDDDGLFDDKADDDDEDYVNRHFRSMGGDTGDDETSSEQKQTARHSDAILSCPCCFDTVCMDCQQHDRFPNQYRAMFVMNVAVNYAEAWAYHTDATQGLVRVHNHDDDTATATTATGTKVPHYPQEATRPVREVFYTVNCANCQTQVAVLDRVDEVYHFTGCLASG